MPVADAVAAEAVGQCVSVELRRRSGAWERAHIHEQRDVNLLQERYEFGERPHGVADGEDGSPRVAIHVLSFVRADPLRVAMVNWYAAAKPKCRISRVFDARKAASDAHHGDDNSR